MTQPSNGIDALLPAEMAARAEAIGVAKAGSKAQITLLLAVLAGAFIAMGAIFATVITTGAAAAGMSYGLTRALAGLAFCLGLIMVVAGGAELFTGNNLIIMAWSSGKITTLQLLRNWGLVYLGNFVGSTATALLIFAGRHYAAGGGAVGLNALATANAKCSLDFVQAVALGMLCNALVCMAVWLTFSARSTTDRILAVLFPITAFVAAGFEHSVANMYFIPAGLMIKAWAGPEFWTQIGMTAADFPALTMQGFLFSNLLPVTIGNILGGALMVGGVYWLIYLRREKGQAGATTGS